MVEFDNVVLTAGKQKKRGALTLPTAAPFASIDFKPKTSSKAVSIRCQDIDRYHWWIQFDGGAVRLDLNGGAQVKFTGLTESALAPLQAIAQSQQKTVTKLTIDTKGGNAGQIELKDQSLSFHTSVGPVFDLPLHLIAQAVAQSRNEVALEFLYDEQNAGQVEGLVEMRLHIPHEGEGEDAMEDEDKETPAAVFARDLQIKGDIGLTATQSIAAFEKLLFAVPRGRYDVELFATFLKLTSATYTYKIAYKNVHKMFLFELMDAGQHLFVIGLNPPVRQGRTAYPYLVVQFDSNEMIEQRFPNIDEKTAAEKYDGVIKPVMKGPSHDVVTRVFKALSKKKVLIAGQSFQAQNNGAAIQCSYKANEGHLFFLEKSFFFLKKPPMHIRHASIASIEFDRLSSANKRFGMKFVTTESGSKNTEYMFTNIPREEFDRVVAFLQEKGLPVVSNGVEDGAGAQRNERPDYSDDSYMRRMEEEGEQAGAPGGGGGDESDSENDEDFTVSSDNDSDSESSGEESEADISEVDEEEEKQPSKKRKKAGADAPPAAKPKSKTKVKAARAKAEAEESKEEMKE